MKPILSTSNTFTTSTTNTAQLWRCNVFIASVISFSYKCTVLVTTHKHFGFYAFMRRDSSTGNKQPGVSRSAQLIMHSYFYHWLLQLNSTLLFQMWLQTFSLGLHNKELCLLTDVISCAGDKTNTQRWNPSDLITTQTTVPSHRPLKRTICLWRVTTLPWIGVWKGGAARLVACCSSSGYLVAVWVFF